MPAPRALGRAGDRFQLMTTTLLWALLLLAGVAAAGMTTAWLRKRRELDELAAAHEAARVERARQDAQLADSNVAMRTQNDLLAVVCREVRGHLDGIIGSADLVLETALQPAQRAQLVTLKTTGESLLYLLNDLQALSQAEFRAAAGEKRSVALRALMAEVIEVLAPRATLKGIELVLIVEPDVPALMRCDDLLLRQFIFNLIACVLRPSGPGSLVVTVSRSSAARKPLAPGKTWLRFAAVGPHDARESELPGSRNPFAVLEQLPLTISRRVTEVLGGEYGEATATDAGPSFWFDLPIEGATDPAQEAPRAVEFLVVWDDLPAARVALARLLDEMGIGYDLGQGVPEVIEALQSALEEHDGPVLLFLDESTAPDAQAELAAEFARRPLLEAVKVVVLSTRPEKVRPPAGLPVCAVLAKPILQPREVQQVLESARSASVLAPVTEHAFSHPPLPLAPGSGPLVLLAEDDEVSCQVNATVLKRLGCRVEVAVDGMAAVTMARRRQYDLIFMDCHMPRLNGFKAAARIRALEGVRMPPIIALTAESAPQVRRQALESGMADFLLKPATRADFRRILDKWTNPAANGVAQTS